MKFVFVTGCSYKSFSLNYVDRIKNADLLIFNQGGLYNFDHNKLQLIWDELISLNQRFACPIAMYGIVICKGLMHRCFLLCNRGKIKVFNDSDEVYLRIGKEYVVVRNSLIERSVNFTTITIIDNQKYNFIPAFYKGNYFICDTKGVTFVNKGKTYRKFQKCCYFILKKNK